MTHPPSGPPSDPKPPNPTGPGRFERLFLRGMAVAACLTPILLVLAPGSAS